MVPKIATGEQDQAEGRRTRHEIIREKRAEGFNIGAKNTQRNRDEHVVESKVGASEHEIVHGKVLDESKVETR